MSDGNMPKTLPCVKCGRKPKRYEIAWGFGDRDNEFMISCDHGDKHTKDFVRVPKENHTYLTERQTVEQWNALQENQP